MGPGSTQADKTEVIQTRANRISWPEQEKDSDEDGDPGRQARGGVLLDRKQNSRVSKLTS